MTRKTKAAENMAKELEKAKVVRATGTESAFEAMTSSLEEKKNTLLATLTPKERAILAKRFTSEGEPSLSPREMEILAKRFQSREVTSGGAPYAKARGMSVEEAMLELEEQGVIPPAGLLAGSLDAAARLSRDAFADAVDELVSGDPGPDVQVGGVDAPSQSDTSSQVQLFDVEPTMGWAVFAGNDPAGGSKFRCFCVGEEDAWEAGSAWDEDAFVVPAAATSRGIVWALARHADEYGEAWNQLQKLVSATDDDLGLLGDLKEMSISELGRMAREAKRFNLGPPQIYRLCKAELRARGEHRPDEAIPEEPREPKIPKTLREAILARQATKKEPIK